MNTNIVSPFAAIDPTPYVRAPKLRADGAISLGWRLLMMQPKEPSGGITQAATTLEQAVRMLEARNMIRARPRPSQDPRPADIRVDRAWGAVDARLRTWEVLEPDDSSRVRATELRGWLFPTGLDFLTLPYSEEHAQSARRMQIIEQEGLREDLVRLVGEPFVHELEQAHAAYGEALGITAPLEPADDPVSLREPLRAVIQAITRYTLQVLAYADLHPDHVAPARRALAPIDEYRQAAARRSGAQGGEADGVEEVEQTEQTELAEEIAQPEESVTANGALEPVAEAG